MLGKGISSLIFWVLEQLPNDMNETKPLSLLLRLRSIFHARDGVGMDVNAIWHIALILFISALLGIGVFSYITYTWAKSDDEILVPAVATRDTQTIAELHNVIAAYNERAGVHLDLRAHPPKAPAYQLGAGIVVATPAVEEIEVEPATTTATTTVGE
jgi:hypothetical protein